MGHLCAGARSEQQLSSSHSARRERRESTELRAVRRRERVANEPPDFKTARHSHGHTATAKPSQAASDTLHPFPSLLP